MNGEMELVVRYKSEENTNVVVTYKQTGHHFQSREPEGSFSN